ncbi:hypothetical protein HK101_010045 [Irineochytrium annulatum]|nr:hypothetical protein HK101_010045 [Irineochytrium annulatum]
MEREAVQNLKLDIGSGIQAEYDSLNIQFKAFLKYAASLGQYFDASLILLVFDLGLQAEEAEEWVATHDLFSFLSLVESDTDKGYYFRHISILTCIYEGISFTERTAIHQKIAAHFEKEMVNSGPINDGVKAEFYLPLVAYHYGRTRNFDKIVKYFDALGAMEVLLEAVKRKQAQMTTIGDNSGTMPSTLAVVGWKRMLAESYKMDGKYMKSMPLLREVLESLGVSFPDGLKKCKKAYRKQLLLQLWLWQRNGGSKDIRSREAPNSEKNALMISTLTTLMTGLTTGLDPESQMVPELKYQRTLLPTEFMRSKGQSLNDDVDGAIEGLAASEEFKKGRNNYLVILVSSAVGQHYWFMGDDKEAMEWTAIASLHTEKAPNRYHRAIFKLPLLLQALFTGNFSGACDFYQHFARELQPPIPTFFEFGTLLPHLIFLSLLLLFPAPFAQKMGRAMQLERRLQILHALSLLSRANLSFMPNMPCVLSNWAQHVANVILRKFTDHKGGRGSLSKLKRMLKGRDGKRVKEWAVLRGYTLF